MISEFCPICGSILEKVPMNIQGVVSDFWVCPEGDWEAPASAEAGAEMAAAPEDESLWFICNTFDSYGDNLGPGMAGDIDAMADKQQNSNRRVGT
jgi:hypothetical protein